MGAISPNKKRKAQLGHLIGARVSSLIEINWNFVSDPESRKNPTSSSLPGFCELAIVAWRKQEQWGHTFSSTSNKKIQMKRYHIHAHPLRRNHILASLTDGTARRKMFANCRKSVYSIHILLQRPSLHWNASHYQMQHIRCLLGSFGYLWRHFRGTQCCWARVWARLGLVVVINAGQDKHCVRFFLCRDCAKQIIQPTPPSWTCLWSSCSSDVSATLGLFGWTMY